MACVAVYPPLHTYSYYLFVLYRKNSSYPVYRFYCDVFFFNFLFISICLEIFKYLLFSFCLFIAFLACWSLVMADCCVFKVDYLTRCFLAVILASFGCILSVLIVCIVHYVFNGLT